MTKLKPVIMLLLCAMPLTGMAQSDDDDLKALYNTLDSLIELQPTIVAEKQKRINTLRDQLVERLLSDEERYNIQQRLYNEFLAFRYDSAHLYVTRNIELAKKMGDEHKLSQSKLQLAHILSVTGLFGKAHELLASIDPNKLSKDELVRYYREQNDALLFESEFAAGSTYFNEYNDSSISYRKKIFELADNGKLEKTFSNATYIIEQGRASEAAHMMEELLKKLKSGDRNYSIITSTLAFCYDKLKQPKQRERYLLLSAISDLQGAIRENNSMRELAKVQFDRGDFARAFNYMNVSLNDAAFYGTRLRSLQVGQLIPEVLEAYRQMTTRQDRQNKVLIAVFAIISLLLAAGLAYIIKIRRRQQENAERIKAINAELSESMERTKRASALMTESNKIKDEYLGRFLELSSTLIDRAENQRKLENRLARDKKLAELYTELKSAKYITECVNDFYNSFDTAFLNIYPSFITEVNKLLSKENVIEPKEEKLTTELRILALIRLGITDNQKIASILRSSITTIYTYRSKLKAKAIDKTTFEEKIKLIEAYHND